MTAIASAYTPLVAEENKSSFSSSADSIEPKNMANRGKESIDFKDALKILMTEVTHQDPFKEGGATDFVGRLLPLFSMENEHKQLETNRQILSELGEMRGQMAYLMNEANKDQSSMLRTINNISEAMSEFKTCPAADSKTIENTNCVSSILEAIKLCKSK